MSNGYNHTVLGKHLVRGAAFVALSVGLVGAASAQAVVKLDDKWRYSLGAGLSIASGNTRSNLFSLNFDGVKANADNKWTFGGRYLRSSTSDLTTADLGTLGTRYDTNMTADWFNFVQGDVLRDRLGNLATRLSAAVGVGRHIVRNDVNTFDVFGGVGYTRDDYFNTAFVIDRFRNTYTHPDLLIGEESTHRLSDTTSFKQKLTLYVNAADTRAYRAVFDTGLAVSINKLLSLTTTLGYRYNSEPGIGFKKNDLVFITGLALKTD